MPSHFKQEIILGLDVIDKDHKEIFKRTDTLLTMCENDRYDQTIKDTASFLSKYVIRHFQTEEHLAKEHRWPLYVELFSEHEHFKKELADIIDKISKQGIDKKLMLHMNVMLVDWWVGHINNIDRELVDFLKTKIK
ncbi:hypothetical protein B9J78_04745 [bacterium Unc6]|nr:hypothetical protein [bacterium Unc6]